jgi:prophage tail gpP-like protein
MAAIKQARLRLVTAADGFEVSTFTSATLKDSFTDPLRPADFEIAPLDIRWEDHRKRLQKGEEVRVYIGEACLGRYLIQEVKRKYGTKGSTMSLSCESLLCTPHEADIDPDFSIKNQNNTSVEALIKQVLAPFGFTVVKTDGTAHVNAISGKPLPGAKPLPFQVKDLKAKQAAAQPGEKVLAFLTKILNRIGVVVRVDGDGAILAGAPNYDQPLSGAVGLSYQPGQLGPDVILFEGEVEIVDSNKNQYSEYAVIGQAGASPAAVVGSAATNPSANASRPKSGAILAKDVLPTRSVYKSSVHPKKPLTKKDKNSGDKATAIRAATLALGARAPHAYSVKGTVAGWYASGGGLFTVDTLHRVVIKPEGLDEPCYLLDRTLHYDAAGGQKTSLTFCQKGALLLGKVGD